MSTPTHSPCRCCGDPVRPILRVFDEAVGFTCPQCARELQIAEEVLEIHGCVGIWVKPFQPNKPKL